MSQRGKTYKEDKNFVKVLSKDSLLCAQKPCRDNRVGVCSLAANVGDQMSWQMNPKHVFATTRPWSKFNDVFYI